MAQHPGLLSRFGGSVSTLFGGRADPRVSQAQNRAASSEGLVTAGLATLLAQGPDGMSPTVIQALAQGALTGRQAGGAARETSVLRNQQAQLQELVGSGQVTPEMLQQLFTQAIANGDIDSARSLAEVIKSTSGSRGITNNRIVEMTGTEGPGKYAVDASGRELFKTGDIIPGTTSSSNFQNLQIYDEPDVLPDGSPNPRAGGKFFGAFDRSLGYVVPVKGAGIPEEEQDIEELLGQAAFYALDEYEQVAPGMRTIRGQAIARGGVLVSGIANALSTDEIQMAATSALNFINPIVRFLSGAQMTDKEAMRYYNALIDAWRDGEANAALKQRMRRNIIKATGFTGVDAQGNLIGTFAEGSGAPARDNDATAHAIMQRELAKARAQARRELIEEGVIDGRGEVVQLTDASSGTIGGTGSFSGVRITGGGRR